MRMIFKHLFMIGITHILGAQAMHNTLRGKAGYGTGEFV
jgi:hypothetical protein